ncbi:MAG: hypothetical protein ABFS05_00775 [Bacteroidota bacterium]
MIFLIGKNKVRLLNQLMVVMMAILFDFIQKYEEKNAVILEMKYPLNAAYIASDISQHLPMRMTKSSKYVNGIDVFQPHLAT